MGKLLNLKEASEILNVQTATIRKMIRNKQIPAIKINNLYRIVENDLQNFINSQRY
jgi:excisionase family DNA binding protein